MLKHWVIQSFMRPDDWLLSKFSCLQQAARQTPLSPWDYIITDLSVSFIPVKIASEPLYWHNCSRNCVAECSAEEAQRSDWHFIRDSESVLTYYWLIPSLLVFSEPLETLAFKSLNWIPDQESQWKFNGKSMEEAKDCSTVKAPVLYSMWTVTDDATRSVQMWW